MAVVVKIAGFLCQDRLGNRLGFAEMQEPFPQVGKEANDFLIISRDEDASVAALGPDLIFRHQLDLDSIPRPFRVAVGLPIDRDGGVDGIADELTEGHAEAVPIEDAVFVRLGKFLGVRDGTTVLVGATMLDDDPIVGSIAFQGFHFARLGAVFEPMIAAEDDGVELGTKQDVDGVLIAAAELPNREGRVVVGQSLAGCSQQNEALGWAHARILDFQVGCYDWPLFLNENDRYGHLEAGRNLTQFHRVERLTAPSCVGRISFRCRWIDRQVRRMEPAESRNLAGPQPATGPRRFMASVVR